MEWVAIFYLSCAAVFLEAVVRAPVLAWHD
jgi:hypothetical protein